MLKIRSQQLTVLGERQRQIFRERLLAHLLQCWPRHAQALPPEELSHVIDHGLSRAAHHRIEGERDIVRYIDCMALLGARFDIDPELRWAADILAASPLSGSAKMARIWQRAKTVALQGVVDRTHG